MNGSVWVGSLAMRFGSGPEIWTHQSISGSLCFGPPCILCAHAQVQVTGQRPERVCRDNFLRFFSFFSFCFFRFCISKTQTARR